MLHALRSFDSSGRTMTSFQSCAHPSGLLSLRIKLRGCIQNSAIKVRKVLRMLMRVKSLKGRKWLIRSDAGG